MKTPQGWSDKGTAELSRLCAHREISEPVYSSCPVTRFLLVFVEACQEVIYNGSHL